MTEAVFPLIWDRYKSRVRNDEGDKQAMGEKHDNGKICRTVKSSENKLVISTSVGIKWSDPSNN